MPPKLFEPRFLNIDWLFNQVYTFFSSLYGAIDYYIFNGTLGSGYGARGIGTGSETGINSGTGFINGNGIGFNNNGIGSQTSDYGSGFSSYGNTQSSIDGGGSIGSGGSGGGFFSHDFFWSNFSTLLSILSIIFITIILYSLVRLYEIRRDQRKELEKILPYEPEPEEYPKNEKWRVVQGHLDSTNPAEWRLAILEADNMLDDMVRKMGYKGENLGERLKAIEPSDFESINNAWEAHKVRNKIAHEGSEFFLSHREARRIVGLYEDVFREFQFI